MCFRLGRPLIVLAAVGVSSSGVHRAAGNTTGNNREEALMKLKNLCEAQQVQPNSTWQLDQSCIDRIFDHLQKHRCNAPDSLETLQKLLAITSGDSAAQQSIQTWVAQAVKDCDLSISSGDIPIATIPSTIAPPAQAEAEVDTKEVILLCVVASLAVVLVLGAVCGPSRSGGAIDDQAEGQVVDGGVPIVFGRLDQGNNPTQ